MVKLRQEQHGFKLFAENPEFVTCRFYTYNWKGYI